MATYADGSPAALRNRFGRGTAWLIGTYAGVEYAWETMQRQPLNDNKRTWVAAPVLSAGVRPVVDAAHPLVEGVLLRKAKTGGQAVFLMNWDFEGRAPRHKDELRVSIRCPASAHKARSLALDRDLAIAEREGVSTFTLPHLAEGDVLLLE